MVVLLLAIQVGGVYGRLDSGRSGQHSNRNIMGVDGVGAVDAALLQAVDEVALGVDVSTVRPDATPEGIWAELYAAPSPTPTSTPTPIPPIPTPIQAVAVLRYAAQAGDYSALICSYDWPCAQALAVVYRTPNCPNGESGGNPAEESPGGDRGLFQINPVHKSKFYARGWTWDDAFDPERNTAVAFAIYVDQGWAPWACRP